MSYNESLNANSNYPPMSHSEWDNAPWNESENREIPVEVTVSVTLSKSFTIYTKDYQAIADEDGNIDYDFSDSNLKKEVEEQIFLPQEAHKYIQGNTRTGKAAIKDLKGWTVDELEVVEE